jgi:predicted HTH transcriptional regulator
MLQKPIKNITLQDLETLIGTMRESRTLEYKQYMPAGTRDEKMDFLPAVSAFANTTGGDLMIGVQAANGVATAIPGIAASDIDAALLRLSNILRDSIEPRLPSVDIHDRCLGVDSEERNITISRFNGRVRLIQAYWNGWRAANDYVDWHWDRGAEAAEARLLHEAGRLN